MLGSSAVGLLQAEVTDTGGPQQRRDTAISQLHFLRIMEQGGVFFLSLKDMAEPKRVVVD